MQWLIFYFLILFMNVSMVSSSASMKLLMWMGEGVPVNLEGKLWSL